MSKFKVTFEYELNTRSANTIWNLISTLDGLSKWIADNVKQDGDTVTFTWGESWGHHETRSADIVNIEKYRSIRFKWNGDDGDDDYWEMKIEQSKETDGYHLIVTDFADADDPDGIKDIWDENMEKLHQASGI